MFNSSFLPGDFLLSASMITYWGVFNSEWRSRLQDQWQQILENANIPFTKAISLRTFFNNESLIEEWQSEAGLSTDNHSVENAIIIEKTLRSTLVVDPQHQAKGFIRYIADNRTEDGTNML